MIFEGNAVVVIQAAKDGSADQSMYGQIIGDIFQQASQLPSCNRLADALVKRASVGLKLQIWLEDCPGNIAPLVFADVP